MKLIIEQKDRDDIVQYIQRTALPIREVLPILGILGTLKECECANKEGKEE